MRVAVAWVIISVLASPLERARAEGDADGARGAATALVKAIAAQDVAAFTSEVGGLFVIRSLWFASPACQQFTGDEPRGIEAAAYPAFLRCAASLDLRVASSTPLWRDDPQQTVLAFAPGGELELRMEGGKIRGLQGLQAWVPSVPVITGKALWAHRVPGPPRIEPDAHERAVIAGDPNAVAFAFLVLCVDEAGKPTTVKLGYHALDFPGYAQAVQDAAAHGTFKPFLQHGKPTPVCSFASLSYPADRVIPPLPPPPPPPPSKNIAPPRNIAPLELDSHRISGDKDIVPDAKTQDEIRRSGRDRIIGCYKICVSTEGNISQVNMLKSMGFSSYDQRIMTVIRGEWRYRPFVIDGNPEPVCTAVTFIYSPAPPPPPP